MRALEAGTASFLDVVPILNGVALIAERGAR
jgi:hypothetical protein